MIWKALLVYSYSSPTLSNTKFKYEMHNSIFPLCKCDSKTE